MRAAWVALVLLLVYLVLVFISFRVLDLIIWCNHGIPSTHIVDPLLLSVRQLKQLLEIRGISYTGYVEKKELVDLVKDSADVLQGEIDELSVTEDKEKLTSTPEASRFTGATHFYEEVEDTKDSVWLVHVVGRDALLDDYTWRVVRKEVAPFAIRTGVFDCKHDPRLCTSKGWTEPLLLLAMPRGSKPKDRVIMRTCQFTRPQAIIEWLSEELSVRVKKVVSVEEVEKEWLKKPIEENLEENSTSTETNLAVKVLLFTHLLHPPLFLAALSIKFTGRITFGIFTVKKDEVQRFGKVPLYLIITPEKTAIYGTRRKEHFNLMSMNTFLKVVQPEMNDLFLCSLVLVNMFAMLHFLQIYTDSWWRIVVASIWTVVIYNLILFACWLLICGAMCWPVLSSVGKWCAGFVRWAALSQAGSLVRSDWLRLPYPLVVLSLFLVGRLAGRKLPRRWGEEDDPAWWEMDCLFRPPDPPRVELEEGLLIERLAVPAFWLTPISSPHYVESLRVWRFAREIVRDSPEAVETLMDGQADEIVTTLSKGDLPLVIETTECAICLEKYQVGVNICGLPCGHNYHQKCILIWLQRDNHHCPICRWPAYKNKQQ